MVNVIYGIQLFISWFEYLEVDKKVILRTFGDICITSHLSLKLARAEWGDWAACFCLSCGVSRLHTVIETRSVVAADASSKVGLVYEPIKRVEEPKGMLLIH